MKTKDYLNEMFGDPIGVHAGESAVGVKDLGMPCEQCKMMPDADHKCGCEVKHDGTCEGCGMPHENCECGMDMVAQPVDDSGMVCPNCGMMVEEPGGACECGMVESKKNKGPSKKTAQKILKGTKTFAEKMKKVSGWADEPAAAAAWMTHKATGKWPQEK